MPSQLLRGIAEDAGIRIFNPHQGDVTYAANGFYCVYVATDGVRSFNVGMKTGVAKELITGQVYAISNGVFFAHMKKNTCAYFLVESIAAND